MNLFGGIFVGLIITIIIISRIYRSYICEKTKKIEIKPGTVINIIDIIKVSSWGIFRISRNNVNAKILFKKDSFHLNTGSIFTSGEEKKYNEIIELEKKFYRRLDIKFKDGYKFCLYFISQDQRDRVFDFLNK